MARDIAALLEVKFKPINVTEPKLEFDTAKKIKAKVEDNKLCSRYMAVMVDGIIFLTIS